MARGGRGTQCHHQPVDPPSHGSAARNRAAPEGMVEKLGLAPILEPIMTEFIRTAEMLIRLGVIDRQED